MLAVNKGNLLTLRETIIMMVKFNIDYHTVLGEELCLNILPSHPSEVTCTFLMTTHDGSNWECEIDLPTHSSDVVHTDYFYSVIRDGSVCRTEWRTLPHHLDVCLSRRGSVSVYDRWTDKPDDSYLFSSAFTECAASHQVTHECQTEGNRLLCFKVRSSQLRLGEHLALLGDIPSLGSWNSDGAVPMSGLAHSEWSFVTDVDSLERQRIEFKFVIIDSEGSLVAWEEGANRYMVLPPVPEGGMVVCELSVPRFSRSSWRGAGTVIPVFSLRSEGGFGVGDFGDLHHAIDWCVRTGQTVLQILPINDTTINYTWSDSYPYNCISIYALHPQYADFRQLPKLKDASRRRHFSLIRAELNSLQEIDYERMIHAKMDYLRELFNQEGESVFASNDFMRFFSLNQDWLVPYAAFSHYRDEYGTASFGNWPRHRCFTDDERARMSNPSSDIYNKVSFWYFVQFVLDSQMRSVHEYARRSHVILKGDIPIGICRDGVEAWCEPRYFHLDFQTGAPPDAFSVNGQNWGFPTYNWDVMLRDGCSWWLRRFRKMAEYFDAYRIDHVLGFFRIWEIPSDSVHGLLGQFSPAIGLTRQEIESYGLTFHEELFLRPYITDWTLQRMFGNSAAEITHQFLEPAADGYYRLRPQFDTQRKVEAWWRSEDVNIADSCARRLLLSLRDNLYSMISNVLFLRDHRNPELFHPRIAAQNDFIYESLSDADKNAFNRLYDDYFYRRNNQFWYDEAMRKLPPLTEATSMLVCAEDLGMIPACVPWVMSRLRILSLEIQSMPKDWGLRFATLSKNPYLSVCTISTHDMPTLRQWWDEDADRAQDFYNSVLGHDGIAPHPLPAQLAEEIVSAHLLSPSMFCLLSLQDWLSIDEDLRLRDPNAERINIPANPRHYWRYRMHITLDHLLTADAFNDHIRTLITQSSRISPTTSPNL